MSANTFKWILFDVTGVIVNRSLTNLEGYTVGSRFFAMGEFEDIFTSKNYISYMKGALSHEQFVGRFLAKKRLDLSVAEFDEILKKDIIPTDGMKALIERLSKKYKIALATNEGKMIAKYKVESSGILPFLSKVVASYLLREVKPTIAFYKKMLHAVNTLPEECIFIDDRIENIYAAKSLGIESIQFINVPLLEADLVKLLIM